MFYHTYHHDSLTNNIALTRNRYIYQPIDKEPTTCVTSTTSYEIPLSSNYVFNIISENGSQRWKWLVNTRRVQCPFEVFSMYCTSSSMKNALHNCTAVDKPNASKAQNPRFFSIPLLRRHRSGRCNSCFQPQRVQPARDGGCVQERATATATAISRFIDCNARVSTTTVLRVIGQKISCRRFLQ